MKCPYCEKEMQKGQLSGSTRSRITWQPAGKKESLFDCLMGNGKLSAADYGLAYFGVEAYFCAGCKKLIIDTDIEHDP